MTFCLIDCLGQQREKEGEWPEGDITGSSGTY